MELTTRDKSVKKLAACDEIVSETQNLIAELFTQINKKVRPRN